MTAPLDDGGAALGCDAAGGVASNDKSRDVVGGDVRLASVSATAEGSPMDWAPRCRGDEGADMACALDGVLRPYRPAEFGVDPLISVAVLGPAARRIVQTAIRNDQVRQPTLIFSTLSTHHVVPGAVQPHFRPPTRARNLKALRCLESAETET